MTSAFEFLLGACLLVVGALFITSYNSGRKSRLIDGIIWVSDNMLKPPGRASAIWIGIVLVVMGLLMIGSGLGLIPPRYHPAAIN